LPKPKKQGAGAPKGFGAFAKRIRRPGGGGAT
jgi:hypothetical protein